MLKEIEEKISTCFCVDCNSLVVLLVENRFVCIKFFIKALSIFLSLDISYHRLLIHGLCQYMDLKAFSEELHM